MFYFSLCFCLAPSAPTSLLIQAVSSSKLRVMWGPPDEPNGNVTRYKLKWTKQVDASYGSVDFCIGSEYQVVNVFDKWKISPF